MKATTRFPNQNYGEEKVFGCRQPDVDSIRPKPKTWKFSGPKMRWDVNLRLPIPLGFIEHIIAIRYRCQ